MRALPEPLRAGLAAGATTLATAWRVTRADGAVRGFTDHDRDLVFDGVVHVAAAGAAPAALEKREDLTGDRFALAGALTVGDVEEDDLRAGLWDGARVEAWRVDWRDPAQRVALFSGRIGAVRRGETAFFAEIVGAQAALDRPFGRVFSPVCDALVGDARCGVDLAAPAFRGVGVVIAAPSADEIAASGLGAFADGWFTRGVLTWADGVRVTVTAHRAAGEAVTLALDGPARAPGAAFTVTAGCDKHFETCRAKFANTLNFRGFPFMPGADAVVAGVDPTQPMDGGSRRTR